MCIYVCDFDISCGLNHTQHLRGAIRLETHPASTSLIPILMSTGKKNCEKNFKIHFSALTYFSHVSQSFPRWETDSKISCEQTLQKGEGPKTSWTRELTNDGELILVRRLQFLGCDIFGLSV